MSNVRIIARDIEGSDCHLLSILVLPHNFPGGTEKNAKVQVMLAGQRAEIEVMSFRVQRRNAKQSLVTFLPAP